MKLLIGLGNPGKEYTHTRHNVGYMVASMICEHLGVRLQEQQGPVLMGKLAQSSDALVVLPKSYMNESGTALGVWERYFHYNFVGADVLLVHDDVDLPLGEWKLYRGGSPAGHHGVESVKSWIESNQQEWSMVSRIRVGIGRPLTSELECRYKGVHEWVLGEFNNKERSTLDQILTLVEEEVLVWFGMK